MTTEPDTGTLDLIRWTFSVDPEKSASIAEYLGDLGLEVLVRDESQFMVLWDEPEGDADEVVESLWELHGTPFEITQEEFHRRSLLHVHHEEGGEDSAEADRAVA
ncbi:MAG: hypothetical protein AB7I30_06325 [Isosphaeraceae bacterium]